MIHTHLAARQPSPRILRHLLHDIAACVLAAISTSVSVAAEQPGPSVTSSSVPNIVFIFADDLGWADVGYQGATYYETPHIDRLAREGMSFSAAYACASNCAPSRACLMSGQYSPRHGVYTVGSSVRGEPRLRALVPIENSPHLPAECVTIAETLAKAGYATACLGKWHLGGGANGPAAQGFDVASDQRDATRLTNQALQFIDRHRRQPFFLYLSHHLVHSPWQADAKLIAKYRQKPTAPGEDVPVYAAMIEQLDDSVGRVLAKLESLELADHTLVVFFSDNGGVGMVTSMDPWLGAKGTFYEGGIRVPLIVRFPGRIAAGQRCDVPVIAVDFYPTLAALARAELPEQPLDGVDLSPLLFQRGELPHRTLYWHFPCYLQSWPCVETPWRTTPVGAIRDGRWKLLEFFAPGGPGHARRELYDLEDDPGENRNLAAELPEQTAALQRQLAAWRQRIGAAVPSQANPRYDPDATYTPRPNVYGVGSHILPHPLTPHGQKALARGYAPPRCTTTVFEGTASREK